MGMLINRHRDRHVADPEPEKSIDEMTVAELREHAKDHGINLAGATKKDDILVAIHDAEDDQEPVPPHDPPAPADPDAADQGNPSPSSDPDQSQE